MEGKSQRFSHGRFLDKADCRLRQQVGGITLLTHRTVIEVPVALSLPLVGEIINRPVVMAIEEGESLGQRQKLPARVAQMPFANDSPALIPAAGQQFRQGLLLGRQSVLGPGRNHGAHHPKPQRPPPGQQTGPWRRTHGAGPKIGEIHPARRQPVQIRRLDDLAAVKSDVRIAKVVGDDDQNVRLRRGSFRRQGRE